jgi:hypothetical protein
MTIDSFQPLACRQLDFYQRVTLRPLTFELAQSSATGGNSKAEGFFLAVKTD